MVGVLPAVLGIAARAALVWEEYKKQKDWAKAIKAGYEKLSNIIAPLILVLLVVLQFGEAPVLLQFVQELGKALFGVESLLVFLYNFARDFLLGYAFVHIILFVFHEIMAFVEVVTGGKQARLE